MHFVMSICHSYLPVLHREIPLPKLYFNACPPTPPQTHIVEIFLCVAVFQAGVESILGRYSQTHTYFFR